MNRLFDNYNNQLVVLAIVVLASLGFMMVGTGTASAHSVQPNGSGTDADPYNVTNWHELSYMDSENATYELNNNIKSNTEGYTEHISDPVGGWNPINDFSGTLDGNNYNISELQIDRTSSWTGLFNTLSSAKIQNLNLKQINNTGGAYAGGIAGYTTGSNLDNISVSGNIESDDGGTGQAGGISAYFSQDGHINNSHFNGNVYANGSAGGIVAENTLGGNITKSYALGSVKGAPSAYAIVGGIAGKHSSDNSNIKNSYASTELSGDTTGGIVGSYNDGTNNTISNSYWNTELSNTSTTGGSGTGLTTEEMKGIEAETNMTGFDFTSNWETIDAEDDTDAERDGYPILQSFDRQYLLSLQGADEPYTSNLTLDVSDADGTVDTDYEILDDTGTTVASGNTGSDGNVVEELEEGTYDVEIAHSDSKYQNITETVTLDADKTVSKTLSRQTYDIGLNIQDENGDDIDVSYKIEGGDNFTVLTTGSTGSDGSVVETVEYDNVTVSVADNNTKYRGISKTFNFDVGEETGYINQSLDLEEYTVEIETSQTDSTAGINVSYTIEQDGTEVYSGYTDNDTSDIGFASESVNYGTYTITVANGSDDYVQDNKTVDIHSDSTVSFNLTESSSDAVVVDSGDSTSGGFFASLGFIGSVFTGIIAVVTIFGILYGVFRRKVM